VGVAQTADWSVLFGFALRPRFPEERKEPISKRGWQPVGERLAEAMDADKVLHVAQVLVTVAPDPTGDLEFNQDLHGGEADPIYIYECVGIRRGIDYRAIVGPGMLARSHHVDVHLVLGFAQQLPQPRASRNRAPADERGMDLLEPLRRRQGFDVLRSPDEAVLPEGQGTDYGKGDALFRQSPTQELQHGGKILGVHVISPQEVDNWSRDLLRHGGMPPYVAPQPINIHDRARAINPSRLQKGLVSSRGCQANDTIGRGKPGQ